MINIADSEDANIEEGLSRASELLAEQSASKVTVAVGSKKDQSIVQFSTSITEIPQSAMQLDELVQSLKEKDYPMLKAMKQNNMENRWVATGFEVPVMYYNVKLMSLYGIPIPYVEDMTLYNELNAFDDYIELVAPVVEVEECSALVANNCYGNQMWRIMHLRLSAMAAQLCIWVQ